MGILNSIKEKLSTYEGLVKELKRKEQKLDDILLYVDFINNKYDIPMVLLKDGSVMVMFEISGIDYEKLSVQDKDAFSNYLKMSIMQMEEGFTLTNYLDRDINPIYPLEENESSPEIIKYIQEKKQEFWTKIAKKSYSNAIFCSLRYWIPGKKDVDWTSLIFEKKLFTISNKELEQKIDKLYQGYLTLKTAFKKFGFFLLQKEDVFNLLYKLINHESPSEYRKDLSLNVQLAQTGYMFKKDTLIINEKYYAKIIAVKYLPKESHALYLERLYDRGIRFVIKQSFEVLNYKKMEKKLISNQNIATSLSNIDKSSENYVNEVKDFMHDVKVNREFPVKWNLSILAVSEDENELEEKVFEIINLLKEAGSTGMVEQHNLKNAYIGMLPGHEKINARNSTILTKNAGDFFIAHLLYRGDENPVEYFVDRTEGIFSYNPFTKRENAWHMSITGPTGGGKSFMVNKLLLSSLVMDPRIYVIDLSKSFTEFFEFLQEELPEDTSILTVSKDEINFSFNPFLINDLNNNDVSEQQMKFCEGLLKIMIGPGLINEGNRIIITDTLKQFFIQYKSILRNLSKKHAPPPLDILIPILEQLSSKKEIPDALRYWQEGRRGKLFNSGIDTVSSAKYVYFDIRNLEGAEDEQSAIIYTIFNKIYTDISKPELLTQPKFLFMDEAHRYLKDPEFSFWIDLLIRTGRHYKLLVGILTQSINDLITDEKWSVGVMNNLKQSVFFSGQVNVEGVFSKLQMNSGHVALYNSLIETRREFLYWSSKGIRRVLSPLTDPYTYWMATTDPNERMLRAQIKKLHNNDTKKTIEACVNATKNSDGSSTENLAYLENYIKNFKK